MTDMLAYLLAGLIIIGGQKYKVVNSCSRGMGEIRFPYNDNLGQREFIICGKLDGLQEKEVIWHEIVHACMQDHPHNYSSLKELNEELQNNKYSGEQIAVEVGECLAELPPNMEETIHEQIHGHVQKHK